MANATTTQKKQPEAKVSAPATEPKKNGLSKKGTATAVATPSDPYERFRALDEATWNRIVNFSKEAERDLDDIVAEIQETVEEPYLAQYDEAHRPLWALRIVASRITVEGLTTADAYLLLVLEIEAPRLTKTKNGPKNVATVRGIAAKYDEKGEAGDASFAEVAFWEGESDKVNDATIGQAYDVKLGGAYKDGRLQLKATPKTNWTKKTELDVKPLEILKELYEKIDLADIGEAAKNKKPVLVSAQVTFSRSGKSAGGNQYGIITIYDESQNLDERGISVFCSPQHIVHGIGSRLWILGTVAPGKKNPDTGENYAPSMNALAIIPEFSVPLAFSKQTTQEARSIKEDDAVETVNFDDFQKGKKAPAKEEEETVDEAEAAPATEGEAEEEEEEEESDDDEE